MEDLKWWQHIYRTIRHGEINCGRAYIGAPKFQLTCYHHYCWTWRLYFFGFYIGGSDY